jgi:hypothetical protein
VGSRVAEPVAGNDPEWDEHARLFAAGLLAAVRQAARRDSLRTALCVGPAEHLLAADGGFRDIRGYADRALQRLEARFRRSNQFSRTWSAPPAMAILSACGAPDGNQLAPPVAAPQARGAGGPAEAQRHHAVNPLWVACGPECTMARHARSPSAIVRPMRSVRACVPWISMCRGVSSRCLARWQTT